MDNHNTEINIIQSDLHQNPQRLDNRAFDYSMTVNGFLISHASDTDLMTPCKPDNLMTMWTPHKHVYLDTTGEAGA